MDTGNLSSNHKRKRSRIYCDENLDRFIPNRSAMNFDFANLMLTGGKLEKETSTPWRESYRKQLAEIFDCNRTRILQFKNKPPSTSFNAVKEISPLSPKLNSVKRMRNIPQSSDRTLDAPEIENDYYLNLLDWSVNNILAIALKNTVYLWNATEASVSQLLSTDDDSGPVTSVKWAPDGRHMAVGFNNSNVQVWDASKNRLLRSFRDIHVARVGSLDWNNHILTTGSLDSSIINNDVRIRSHNISTYIGHNQEVCGLRWSPSGQQLASGGNDNRVFIWDLSLNQRLHRFSDHTAAVKALAWCPFQSNLLASGGGNGDQCIKFWNSHTGICLNSVNTGSQVSGLLWNRHERELLSSHGLDNNQLIVWKYPSMVKLAELHGHTSRVLNITQSPDGYKVASVAADETIRLWNVFGTPEMGKNARKLKTEGEPFASFARIR